MGDWIRGSYQGANGGPRVGGPLSPVEEEAGGADTSDVPFDAICALSPGALTIAIDDIIVMPAFEIETLPWEFLDDESIRN